MQLFLKKIGFILLVFMGLAMLLAACSLWSLRQSSFYKPSFLVHQVSEKEFDYIVLGASTGLTTLNTKVIDSVLQTNGLNLSMDDTALSSQYLMLQHFLAQGKTAKFCVLAPSVKDYGLTNNVLSGNDYRFLPYINSSYVSNYYKQFTSNSAKLLSASKWLPMLGVSYFNTELFFPSLLALVQPSKRNRFDAKGNYTYPVNKEIDIPINVFKPLPIAFRNSYLEKINDLCEANNIKLLCYFSPLKSRSVVVSALDFNIINHSAILTNEAYFYDDIHVNSKGRQLSSVFFAKELQEALK